MFLKLLSTALKITLEPTVFCTFVHSVPIDPSSAIVCTQTSLSEILLISISMT